MAKRYPHVAQQRDERAHGVIQDAIDRGYLDSGQKYLIKDLPTHTAAREAQVSIIRGLKHFNLSPSAWVTDSDGNQCYRDCADPSAPHGAGFELHSKRAAQRYLVEQTGGDPSKLKYNPYAPRRQGHFSDDGQWIPASNLRSRNRL